MQQTHTNQQLKFADIRMLQGEIIFKQLQELQQRRQLQELSDPRNQNYVNQMLSLKRASGAQFPPIMHGNDGSRVLQGLPNGLILSQSHSNAMSHLGLSQQQFDISLYGTPAANIDKNLNQYSDLQGPSNHSVNLLTKNNNSSLGMALVQPSAFGSSFMSQRCNFSSDQISMPDGSLLSNQEKNLFGQVPIQSFNRGITIQRNASSLESGVRYDDAGWDGHLSKTAALDPLEQKILYNTDDNSWESSFSRSSKTSTRGFESTVEHTSYMDAFPSIQSGNWSGLMQSAVAETSTSDTGIQEEWSGLSFQNPESLNDNQSSNFIDREKLQNSWVDRNLKNVSSPSSKPEHLVQNFNMNFSFPGCQQSGPQYLKQKDECYSESTHVTTQHSIRNTNQLADYNSQQKFPTGGTQMIQTSLPSPNVWPAQLKEHLENYVRQPSILSCTIDNQPRKNFSGDELRGAFWLQGNTSHHVAACQKPFNQGNSRATSVSSHNMNDDMKNQCSAPPVRSHMATKFPDLFRSPDSASSCLETSSGAPNEQPNHDSFEHEYTVQELGTCSGKSEYHEQRLEKGSSLHEGSTEMNNSTFLSTHKQEFMRKHQSGAFGHPLSQNYSLLHQVHSTRNAETGSGNSFPPKYDNVNYQHSIANARELFLSGEKPGVKDKAKSDLYAISNLGAFRAGDNKEWNFSQEVQGDQLRKASRMPYNFQPMDMSCQNDSKMILGNLQENSLIMQVNLANSSQGSGLWPSTAATSIASKQLNPPCVLPSDVTHQILDVSQPKKRKLVAFDMVPWHKEVNHESLRLQDISTAELVWAQDSNRRQEEVRNEAEIVEDLLPVVRAKRRLIFTTQLMQQVYRPAPAVILCSNASLNCNYVTYSTARLALGDACSLTGQLPTDSNDMSPDKLKTSKTNGCEFSKVVECFISRVKKLEGDLSRLDKSLSFVDIKVETRVLEKFSMISRFAKFHMKAPPNKVDPASSSGTSTLQKTKPQKYVVGLPMPTIVPEGIDCLSL